MKKKISVNDCKSMFNDKFNTLTMKELGIELKHFSMGTAPENPSFLVNQDELKKKITEKFCDFFDVKITEINRSTDFSKLSNEDIESAIDDYYMHKENYKKSNRNIEAIRKLLPMAKNRKLYSDADIRAMGGNVE